MLITTAEDAGNRPLTHAFIIGVSRYPFADGAEASEWGKQFGITNLSTAARSASDVAAWLLDSYNNPDAPLGSIRILLSPAAGEQVDPRFGGTAATRNNVELEFLRFAGNCALNRDNVAIVYIAGHGVQLTTRGALVLLEDFGTPDRVELYGAIDVAGCHQSLQTPGSPNRSNCQYLWIGVFQATSVSVC